ENYVQSPVQPALTANTLVLPFISSWVNGVTSVVANYAATLSMKVEYPIEYKDPQNNKLYNITEFFLEAIIRGGGEPVNLLETPHNFLASKNETIWVPFSQLDFSAFLPPPFDSLIEGAGIELKSPLVALYSSSKSWLEGNVTAAKDVNTIAPDPSEWGNTAFPVATMLALGSGAAAPQLYLVSDPSIFINKYVGEKLSGSFDPSEYDNQQFARNMLSLLLADRPGGKIYFDEGHLAQSYISPLLYMGLFFRFLDLMSMFPLTALLLPITVVGLARKYAPKGRKSAAPLLMTRVQQYSGRSYFAFKMRWLLEFQNYGKGLELIYRRVRREMTKRYSLEEWSPEIAYYALVREYPGVKKDLIQRLNAIEVALVRVAPMTEPEFMKYYLTLKEITDIIRK
ncbi:MAG TPA: hypothetical protein VJ044_16240, partial [Candidatus Hodarchaeales archaeon]|nr:hypothetical protein [Candidatus Hodarchaeales archaeon]